MELTCIDCEKILVNKKAIRCKKCNSVYRAKLVKEGKIIRRTNKGKRWKLNFTEEERIKWGNKSRGEKNNHWRGGITKDLKVYHREYHKRYIENNREFINFLNKVRSYKRKSAGGSFTLDEWETLKAQYNWTCPACLRKEPEVKLTVDHIIPITKGGSSNIENLQPLCLSCNSRKGNRVIIRY